MSFKPFSYQEKKKKEVQIGVSVHIQGGRGEKTGSQLQEWKKVDQGDIQEHWNNKSRK